MSQKASAVKRAQQSEIQPHQLVLLRRPLITFGQAHFATIPLHR